MKINHEAIENVRAERARILMISRALEAMNFEVTRASADIRDLLVKLREHEDATGRDLLALRRGES
jgi:hypothetical protein